MFLINRIKIETVNIRQGLFRLWILSSFLWCICSLIVGFQNYLDKEEKYSYMPILVSSEMEEECGFKLSSQDTSGLTMNRRVLPDDVIDKYDKDFPGFKNCVENAFLKERKEETIWLVIETAFYACMLPILVFIAGFFSLLIHPYILKSIRWLIIRPIKWVLKGFLNSEAKQ